MVSVKSDRSLDSIVHPCRHACHKLLKSGFPHDVPPLNDVWYALQPPWKNHEHTLWNRNVFFAFLVAVVATPTSMS